MQRSAPLTQRQKQCLSLAALGIFVLLSAFLFFYVGKPMLAFVSEPERFRSWVDSHGIGGRFAFIGMVVLQVIVAVIPGEPLELGAGYAFGFWEGTLLCLIGIVLGSALVFLLVRYFGVQLVEVFFPREKIDSLKFLQNTRRRDLLLFLVLFIPGTPKDLLSYFAGLTRIRLGRWLLIAGLARIPSVVTSTLSGNALGVQNYPFAVAAVLATLAVSALGVTIYRRLGRRQESAAAESAAPSPDRTAPQ